MNDECFAAKRRPAIFAGNLPEFPATGRLHRHNLVKKRQLRGANPAARWGIEDAADDSDP
jgi:hypothetical protein